MNTNTLYRTLSDVINAPQSCPCGDCIYLTDFSCIREKPLNVYNFNNCQNTQNSSERVDLLDTGAGGFDELDTGAGGFDIHAACGGNAPTDVIAGFVRIGDSRFKECLKCGLSLCDDWIAVDPWREHARWCPFCPFVISTKGEKFVHEVIAETKQIVRYYRDKKQQGRKRNGEMDSDAIIEAMQKYPNADQADIIDAIQWWFKINGEFPTRDDLLYDLESRILYKTVQQSLDYYQ